MISVYKRDSDANSNALSQDTAFNGIKASIDKRVKSSAKKNSVFAGDLNLSDSTASRIEQKRNGARKQAKKLIQDAWDKDTNKLAALITVVDDGKMTAYIRYLVVAPNYRGKGINDELIAQVKAKYENYPYLFAFAPDDFHASFFSKLGFNVLDGAKVLAR